MAAQNTTGAVAEPNAAMSLPAHAGLSGPENVELRDRPARELIGELARLENAVRAALSPATASGRSSLADPDLARSRAKEREIIAELRRRRAIRQASRAGSRPSHHLHVQQVEVADPWSAPW